MLAYVARRLGWALVLFLAVTAIAYAVFFVVPADPARLACGQRATPECVASARHYFGLDRSLPVQYGSFLKRLVVDGSLGRSFATRQSVGEIVASAAPVSASLVLGGALLWLLVSIPLGVLSALRPRSLVDRGGNLLVLAGISAHPVWIGLLLAYFVGYKAGLAPITGYCDLVPSGESCGGPLAWASHLVLPWVTFALLYSALYVRMIRASTLETLNEDYVRTARAKGASEWRVIRAHVLRNAMLPVVTMLGMDVGLGLGSAVFTETVFGLPGLGKTLVASISSFDLPVTMGIVVFTTLVVVGVNLVVDLLYAVIDPRIRTAAA